MTQKPESEDQARDLFARQLHDLRRRGTAPDSAARLAAIFAGSEARCREQEASLTEDETAGRRSTPQAS